MMVSHCFRPLLAFLLLGGCAAGYGELSVPLDTPLPESKAVVRGRLENGLTYYIRQNAKPEDRVLLRLLIHAGSLQEDESQRGLAHFLEHMAFNGTARFPGHGIKDFLEEAGMRFGSHLNASTGFGRTIYKLEIPTTDEALVAKSFQVMRDWADGIALDEAEIENERGIILEERRARLGVGTRVREAHYPKLYNNSLYAERLPIGEVAVIENASREAFSRFYEDWYRPSLAAVVVVGDIDPDTVASLIQENFSSWEEPAQARERASVPIGGNDMPLVSIVTDPELTTASLAVYNKVPLERMRTVGDFRDRIVERMYLIMLNDRLGERRRRADPPFRGAALRIGTLGDDTRTYGFSLAPLEDQYERGLAALYGEVERVRRDGFLASELERIKTNMLRSYQRSYDERLKRNSSSFIGSLFNHFTDGDPIFDIEDSYALVQELLPSIALEEVRRVGDRFAVHQNQVVLFDAPDEGFAVPEATELLAALNDGTAETLAAYDDGVDDATLVADLPAPGEIVEESHDASVDVHYWRLSNGIRVFAKKTDFKDDEILVDAYSPGGTSLYSDSDYRDATFGDAVASMGGMGDFDSIALGKLLAGKSLNMGMEVGSLYETVDGRSSVKDLETLLQLIHLGVTRPRLDLGAFESSRTRRIAQIENRLKNPGAVFGDAVLRTMYQDHPRRQPPTVESLSAIDPERAFGFYEERFADMSDFTFFFVGNLEIDRLKQLSARYLATLPSTNREEKGRDVGDEKISGQHELSLDINSEAQTAVRVYLHGKCEWSPERALKLGFARDVLRHQMRETLREENSGVYGVSVSGRLRREPTPGFSSGFSFTCDPEKADELLALAFGEIEKLKTEGPSASHLEKVRAARLKSYEKSMLTNRYWLRALRTLRIQEREFATIHEMPERLAAVTAEEVRLAAVEFYDTANRLTARLEPKPDL